MPKGKQQRFAALSYTVVKMLKLSATLQNLRIISLRTGGPVGLATAAILNPHNLKIVGWWCRVPATAAPMVLMCDDIRDISSDTISINDEEDIVAAEDLARHREILDINYELIGKTVKTKHSKIGKVTNFSYNDGMFVQKLYVEKPMHKVFSLEDTVLIDRNQVLEVTDRYILVKDTDVKVKESEMSRVAAEPA
jgi:sporulation protein YlmC with PRC-barrel domain